MTMKSKKTLAEKKLTVKYWRKRADTLFSEVERKKHERCQVCDKEGVPRANDGAMIKGHENGD